MKRLIALSLAVALTLTACGKTSSVDSTAGLSSKETSVPGQLTESIESIGSSQSTSTEPTETIFSTDETLIQTERETEDLSSTSTDSKPLEYVNIVPEFSGLDDTDLLRYVEDNVYTELVHQLNDNNYFVENVSAVYVSDEYLEELAFNSQSNVFFGYSLAELDEQFDGNRYVFSLGDDGTTIVKTFEDYDDTYEQVIKNVAIGTGVILVCVTVSVATAGAGAPAVSMIFAAAAKTGATFALSSGAMSFAASSIVTGIQTGNPEEAIKAGVLAGSESFKWGAIIGSIAGGASEGIKYAKAMEALKGVSLEGITTQQAAAMQMESGYPIDIIKQFHSMEEYYVYKDAGLEAQMITGQLALVRDIDLTYESELTNGEFITNLERMARGYAPLDPATGTAYELHHIGQKADATLAVLTKAEHQGNSTILNMIGKESEIDRNAFDAVRKAFWKAFADAIKH